MDGLLIVDKPSGPTSHDVVARLRRVLREKRIGHTGTLDPMATGVMLLVVGKATRLAAFLSASDKSYDAVVRFGFATDTADAQGQPIGPPSERPIPSRAEIDTALEAFRGTFLQQPPAFSAKKIDGRRSYKLARNARLKPSSLDVARDDPERVEGSRYEDTADVAPRTAHPAPPAPPALSALPALPALPALCRVTTTRLEIVDVEADTVTLRVDCSAGFYIRSLAHDLGDRLGVGAHLTALRRTRSGDFGLDRALPLDAAERDPQAAAAAMVPLSGMLSNLPAVVLTPDGANRVSHGQDIRPIDREPINHEPSAMSRQPFLRLLDPRGVLLAIAEPTGSGVLHPSVVLV